MKRTHRMSYVALGASLALSAVGCTGKESAPPPAQVQSQSALPANSPAMITGCLKAGEAANTFVVTTAKSEGGSETATYQLVGNPGANLSDHIGRRVEVTGVIRQSQELASTERARPAEAKGTAGSPDKPTVETRTDVEIKQLEVSSIKSVGGRCD